MKQLNLYYLGGGSGPTPDIPDGKTITPINDVEIWQECAGLTPVYTTLAGVLNDSGYTAALMSDDNAVDYMVRSTEWTSSITVPIMTSDNTPEGTCFADNTSSGHAAYRAFDGINGYQQSESWASTSTNSKVGYIFPNAVEISRVNIQCPANVNTNELNAFKIQYSDDGTEWNDATDILYFVSSQPSTAQNKDYTVNYVGKHRYWAILAISCYGNLSVIRVCEAQFYSVSIPSSQTAMQYIGASDYASNTLLADSTWREALCSSDYFESILSELVPTMTSNTTPSGVASGTTIYNSNFDYYKAFIGGDVVGNVVGWCPSSSDTYGNSKVIYDFGEGNSKYIYKIRYSTLSSATFTFKIAGSNNGTSFTDISNNFSFILNNSTGAHGYANTLTTNNTAYRYIAAIYMATGSGGITSGSGFRFQYYGKRENGGVQTWLKAANIKKNYYSLSQVLADTATLTALMNSEDAVDYLVTVRSWIPTIVSNEAAMIIISQSNYASNTLLADSDWCKGICDSTYFESVLNIKVPVMTSDNTPKGLVFNEHNYANAYKVFANLGIGDNCSVGGTSVALSEKYVGYMFEENDICIKLISYRSGSNITKPTLTFSLEGSIDGTEWSLIQDGLVTPSTQTVWQNYYISSNTDLYKYFRVYTFDYNNYYNGTYRWSFSNLQFYGRKDV